MPHDLFEPPDVETLLAEYAQRCLHLADQSKERKVRRMLRLLAIDLKRAAKRLNELGPTQESNDPPSEELLWLELVDQI